LVANHQQQAPAGEAHLRQATHGQVGDLPPSRWHAAHRRGPASTGLGIYRNQALMPGHRSQLQPMKGAGSADLRAPEARLGGTAEPHLTERSASGQVRVM
jgi:hypothetical protein